MAVIISARGYHWYDVPIEEARHGLSLFQIHLLEDVVLGNSPRDFPGFVAGASQGLPNHNIGSDMAAYRSVSLHALCANIDATSIVRRGLGRKNYRELWAPV